MRVVMFANTAHPPELEVADTDAVTAALHNCLKAAAYLLAASDERGPQCAAFLDDARQIYNSCGGFIMTAAFTRPRTG